MCLVKTLIAWIILGFVGTNLLGLLVRGLMCAQLPIEESTDRLLRDVLESEYRRLRATNFAVTLASAVLTVGYIVALYYFWNLALGSAAMLMMLSRLPDLLWEIRNGKKMTRSDRPHGGVYVAATVVLWLCLPLIWFALCK